MGTKKSKHQDPSALLVNNLAGARENKINQYDLKAS